MLSILKPSPSTTYGEVILGLIEDAVPSLPRRYNRIKRLEQKDPRAAAEDWYDLQQEMIEEYTIEHLNRKKENEDEEASKNIINMSEY